MKIVPIKIDLPVFTTKVILVFNTNLKEFLKLHEGFCLTQLRDDKISTIIQFVENKEVDDVDDYSEVLNHYNDNIEFENNLMCKSFYNKCSYSEMLDIQKQMWEDFLKTDHFFNSGKLKNSLEFITLGNH